MLVRVLHWYIYWRLQETEVLSSCVTQSSGSVFVKSPMNYKVSKGHANTWFKYYTVITQKTVVKIPGNEFQMTRGIPLRKIPEKFRRLPGTLTTSEAKWCVIDIWKKSKDRLSQENPGGRKPAEEHSEEVSEEQIRQSASHLRAFSQKARVFSRHLSSYQQVFKHDKTFVIRVVFVKVY